MIELPEPGPLMAAFRSEVDFTALSPDDFGRVMGAIERQLEEHFTKHDLLRHHEPLGHPRMPGRETLEDRVFWILRDRETGRWGR